MAVPPPPRGGSQRDYLMSTTGREDFLIVSSNFHVFTGYWNSNSWQKSCYWNQPRWSADESLFDNTWEMKHCRPRTCSVDSSLPVEYSLLKNSWYFCTFYSRAKCDQNGDLVGRMPFEKDKITRIKIPPVLQHALLNITITVYWISTQMVCSLRWLFTLLYPCTCFRRSFQYALKTCWS